MPYQDKYDDARLDGSPLGFGRPAVPQPRPAGPDAFTKNPPAVPQARPAGPDAFTKNPPTVPEVAAPTSLTPRGGGRNNPTQLPASRPSVLEQFNQMLQPRGGAGNGQGRNRGTPPGVELAAAPYDLEGGQGRNKPRTQNASQVPVGTPDITPERGRDIATGAVPVAEQTATEVATAAAGGTNAGVEGASESRPASAATLAPEIGDIPKGAIEVIRGAPFGRGQTQRSFATPDAHGRFFESTDPRSSIQQGRIAGATRNPGSVESAQNAALLGLTNPTSSGIVQRQNEGQLERENKLAVQGLRNEGVKKGQGGGAALPDLATYVFEAMSQGNMTEDEAVRAYYIEYAEAQAGGE